MKVEHSCIPSCLYHEHCVHRFPRSGHASKHNWPIKMYLINVWFMKRWLLIGRRWCNRWQGLLVLNIPKCHEKSQCVTVTLTAPSVIIWRYAKCEKANCKTELIDYLLYYSWIYVLSIWPFLFKQLEPYLKPQLTSSACFSLISPSIINPFQIL